MMGRRRVLVVEAVPRAELERLSRSGVRGGGPGSCRAVVAGGRDERFDRDAAGRAGRAGAALALVVPLGRGHGPAGLAATGTDAAQAGSGTGRRRASC